MCNNMMIQFMMAMQQMQQPYMWTGQTGLNLPYTNTIMPSWSNTFTPYYNFSNTTNEGAGGTNNSTNNIRSMQNMMNQLGFTEGNGYSVAQTADGSLQFTYNKDGKTYIAKSLADLTNQISENKDTTPASLEDSIAIHKEENEEAPEEEDDAVDDDHAPASPSSPDEAPAPAKRNFKKARDMKLAGRELEWISYNQIDAKTHKWRNRIENGITVDQLVNIMASKGKEEEKQAYKQWLIDANPNAIKDGKVVDVTKLDLPVYKATSTNNTKKATKKVNKKTNTNVNKGCNIKYDETGSPHYYIDTTEVNKDDFNYFNTKTSYKKDELADAIKKYDSISGNNRVKNVIVETPQNDNGNLCVTVNYKGNGIFGSYYQTIVFNGSNKDQTIHQKMEQIYNDLMQGYDK